MSEQPIVGHCPLEHACGLWSHTLANTLKWDQNLRHKKKLFISN